MGDNSANIRKSEQDNSANIRKGQIINIGNSYYDIVIVSPCEKYVVAVRGEKVALIETMELYMDYEYRAYNNSWWKAK